MHNTQGSRGEHSKARGSGFGHNGRSQGGGLGRPPGLKGKEIGLYYRDKARAKAKRKEICIIKLSQNVQEKIESILVDSEGFYDKLYNSEPYARDTNNTFEDRYVHIHDSQFKKKFLNIVSGNIQDTLGKALCSESKLEKDTNLDQKLLDEYKAKQYTEEYENMMKFRRKLPSYDKKSEIIQLIIENQVVVISGETGCGKTTQVAQFILDSQIEQCNGSTTRIVCTQPRRISAISVAERVAAERTERLGKSVGFQIRLEKVLPRDRGSILFCTTGMLLQFLQNDPALKEFSHIVLDEIHERSTESDFILALLKLIIPIRPDLKVLLMSATLNSERFSEYYNHCPMIHIPGFTFPVEEFYLEDILSFTNFSFPETHILSPDGWKHRQKFQEEHKKRGEFNNIIVPYIRQLQAERKYSTFVINELRKQGSEIMSLELIEELIKYICCTQSPGAILVFLPGMIDISKLHRMLQSSLHPQNQYVIYPLHSRMPTVDQKIIFKEPPHGVRKIIIATSIAETSITIEDVVYVVDCGKTKFAKFDLDKNVQTLEPEWVSLANAKQRRGRAGRVKPGVCYHLYTRGREMSFKKYPLPEILGTRLEKVILQIKLLQLGKAQSFLDKVIDPPRTKAIELSLELLRTLNALDDEEHLTPLGYHLARLPLDPRTGKMIIWAALFSCVQPVFAIAASLNFKDAFYCPLGREDEANERKVELNMNEFSDHIAFSEALTAFELAYNRGGAGAFCKKYFLSFNTLKLLSEMKTQFAQHLCDMKFLETENPSDQNANINSRNITLVKAIVCAGLYPNIAVIKNVGKRGIFAWTAEDGRVCIHPSSVNGRVMNYPSPFMTYFTKQKSTAIYLHDTTCVSGPIVLFAASYMCIRKEKGKYIISLAGYENFRCDSQTAQLIQKLQEQFNYMLKYKITHPGTVSWNGYEGNLLNAIIDLACEKDEEMGFSYS